ncbi:MAG: hypothetical protein R2697_14105 [Ilumatobacteraceae bacterium]
MDGAVADRVDPVIGHPLQHGRERPFMVGDLLDQPAGESAAVDVVDQLVLDRRTPRVHDQDVHVSLARRRPGWP